MVGPQGACRTPFWSFFGLGGTLPSPQVALLERCRFLGPISQFIPGHKVEGLVTFSIDRHYFRVPRFHLS